MRSSLQNGNAAPARPRVVRLSRVPGFRRVRYRTKIGVVVLPGHLIAAEKGRKAYLVHQVVGARFRLCSEGGPSDYVTHRLVVETVGRSALKEPDAVVHWIVWDAKRKKRR